MMMHIVSGATFVLGLVLLLRWRRAHRASDRQTARRMCLFGAVLGLAHLLWEVYGIKAAGAPPAKGSPEQGALMVRVALLGFPANLLLLIGIFELSFKNHLGDPE